MPLNTANIEEAFISREEGIKKLLSSILNLNVHHESNEKCIISIINRLLSTAKNRKEGLEYLNLVVNNCSSSSIVENALNWVNNCIIKFPDDILRELKLRVLGKIIEVSHVESDFNKKFISDYISKVLDNCITTSHVNQYECKTALRTLTVCMKYYASWFGLHRQKIENFILIFLDSSNEELVQAAALAFHYLQQVGSAGSNGTNHKLNFTQNFDKLCKTNHRLYDTFFENERELYHFDSSEDEVFEFPNNPAYNFQTLMHVNARRILNVFKFIEAMIKNKYPVAKETKPKVLLEVITRGLTIHKCVTGDNEVSLETYQFSLLLLEIQCAALKLLRLFIIWYQTNCLPLSYSISKVLVDSIEKTHNCDCYNSNSLYQESAYRALLEWITIAKSSLHPQFQIQLLECILRDITPIKSQVTLTISEPTVGIKSQKAKRRAMANRIISSGNQSMNRESVTLSGKCHEGSICQFALEVLRSLLEATRLNVKSSLLKNLYKSILDSLINVQTGKPLHPYTNPHCQVNLYKVLVAIYHQNTLSVLPPLQASLSILNRGANDRDRFVASICHEGLRILESFCQPICPSLYISVDKEDEEDDVERPRSEQDDIQYSSGKFNESVDGGDRASVDFDASTDEFPNHTRSESQDSRSGTNCYHVRYTDTDRSSVDDALSEKGTNNEEVIVEELDPHVPQSEQQGENEMKISEFPVVTAPSEDGNEILEGRDVETEKIETIPEDRNEELPNENTQDISENSANTDIITDQQTEEIHTTKTVTEEETAHSTEGVSGSQISKNESKERSRVDEINENEAASTTNDPNISHEVSQNADEFISSSQTPSQEHTDERAKFVAAEDHDDVFVESSDDLRTEAINSEEFVAKKPRLMTDEEMKDDFVESTSKQQELDPDAIFVEDNSFVDEVKDYY